MRRLPTPRSSLRAPLALTIALVFAGCSNEAERERAVSEKIANGTLDEAQVEVDGWLDRRPSDPKALAWAARVALARDLPEDAAEFARKAQQGGLPREELRDVEGIVLSRAGRAIEAAPLLQAYLAGSDRLEPMAARALAEAGMATFNFLLAREALARWKQDAPDDPEAWLFEARLAELAGDYPESIVAPYREALRRDPEHDEARLGLAEILFRDSRHEEAAVEFEAYLRRHPDDPEALAGAGLNKLAVRDFEGAEPMLSRVLEHDPKHLEALKGMARLAQQAERFDEALGLFARAAELEPSDADIPYQQSLMLTRLGRPDEARQMRERADQLREVAQEIKRLRMALVHSPNNLTLQYEAARWLIEHGHADEGIRWAQQVLKVRASHRPTCLLLAEYYESTGQPDLAGYYRWQAGPEDRTPGPP